LTLIFLNVLVSIYFIEMIENSFKAMPDILLLELKKTFEIPILKILSFINIKFFDINHLIYIFHHFEEVITNFKMHTF